VPTALAIDLLGWAIKLGGLISGIKDIEIDLDRIHGAVELDLPQVMRLVSEYNCQVVIGIPIHNWMFNKWHDEISELWKDRTC